MFLSIPKSLRRIQTSEVISVLTHSNSSIEDEFDVEIPDREVANLETLGDAIKIIQKYMEDW